MASWQQCFRHVYVNMFLRCMPLDLIDEIAALAISIYNFNHDSFLCLWNMCISEHYMGSWKLCRHHCCDKCLLLAHEFLKIHNWLNVLRFVSEIHICSCYFRLFLHAFPESAYGIFGSASIFRSAFCNINIHI